MAPELKATDEQVFLSQVKDRCGRQLAYSFEAQMCASAGYVANEVRLLQLREREEYMREHVHPTAKFLETAAEVGAFVLAVALVLRLMLNLHRYVVRERLGWTVPGPLSHLVRAARSRNAEREYMRYKRLHDNGLMTAAEFAAKKAELKPKILD